MIFFGRFLVKPSKPTKNIARCTKCGDIIESKHVHDFKWCSCKSIAIYGGHEYQRFIYLGDRGDIDLSLSEYEEEN